MRIHIETPFSAAGQPYETVSREVAKACGGSALVEVDRRRAFFLNPVTEHLGCAFCFLAFCPVIQYVNAAIRPTARQEPTRVIAGTLPAAAAGQNRKSRPGRVLDYKRHNRHIWNLVSAHLQRILEPVYEDSPVGWLQSFPPQALIMRNIARFCLEKPCLFVCRQLLANGDSPNYDKVLNLLVFLG